MNFFWNKPKIGFYKTKYAKDTIIKTFDIYDGKGSIKFSLIKGGNLSETKDGIGCMGLSPDVPGKDRFYSLKGLKQYFEYIGEDFKENKEDFEENFQESTRLLRIEV